MNAEQKDQIRQLHSSGLGYKKIAAQLGLSVNTVASLRFTWTYCQKRLQFRRKRGNMDTSKGGAEA